MAATLSPAEVAERWGVTEWAVRQLVRSGTLRKLPLARPTRIPLAAVIEVEEGYAIKRIGIASAELVKPIRRLTPLGVVKG